MPSQTLCGKPFGKVGLGIMHMTLGQTVPRDQAIAAIKTAVDAGQNIVNSATFYGPPDNPYASIQLLRAFFEAHPDYADKITLGVKGGADLYAPKVSGQLDFLRAELDEIERILGKTKKVDIFIPSRVPDDVSLEQLFENLSILKNEGRFTAIGISEVKAETLRRAHALHPISTVENELSLFNLDPPALEVVKACEELGVVLTAYSPLGRGMLTKRFKTLDDLPPDDMRRHWPRFQGDNFAKNIELADRVEGIAHAKGVTGAQLALAYIMNLSPAVVPLQGSSNSERIVENGGAADVRLTQEEVAEIQKILDGFEIQGDRYPDGAFLEMK